MISNAWDLALEVHIIPLKKNLYANESYQNCSFNYEGNNNTISEDGKANSLE